MGSRWRPNTHFIPPAPNISGSQSATKAIPNNLSRTEVPHPAPTAEYTYGFTARLAPRIYPARYARYRICKQVYKTCPYRSYLLTTEFTVTPFVPFTRFAEPAQGQDIQF